MKLWNYLLNSNIQVAFNLNPFIWKLDYYSFKDPSLLGKGNGMYKLTILFLQLTLLIDNGIDVIPDQSGVWDKYEPMDDFE